MAKGAGAWKKEWQKSYAFVGSLHKVNLFVIAYYNLSLSRQKLV